MLKISYQLKAQSSNTLMDTSCHTSWWYHARLHECDCDCAVSNFNMSACLVCPGEKSCTFLFTANSPLCACSASVQAHHYPPQLPWWETNRLVGMAARSLKHWTPVFTLPFFMLTTIITYSTTSLFLSPWRRDSLVWKLTSAKYLSVPQVLNLSSGWISSWPFCTKTRWSLSVGFRDRNWTSNPCCNCRYLPILLDLFFILMFSLVWFFLCNPYFFILDPNGLETLCRPYPHMCHGSWSWDKSGSFLSLAAFFPFSWIVWPEVLLMNSENVFVDPNKVSGCISGQSCCVKSFPSALRKDECWCVTGPCGCFHHRTGGFLMQWF